MLITTQLLFTSALLAYACWRDLSARMIPDATCLTLAGVGLAARLPLGAEAALLSLLTASVLLVILLFCAIRGWLGGGDVKLASAVAVGMSPSATWDFTFFTAMAGGLLGLLYLSGPCFAPRLVAAPGASLLLRLATVEARRLRRRGPLPYGFAITAGALVVLAATPH